jgi:hypothetical protein
MRGTASKKNKKNWRKTNRSKKYKLVKKYYDEGYWTKEMVYNAVVKGWITEQEYHEIVGE